VRYRLHIRSLGGFSHIERFYADFEACLFEPRIQELELDLTAVTFIMPEAVLALLCAARCWYDSRGKAIALVSVDAKVHKYLHRVDLFDECGTYLAVTGEITEPWLRSSSTNLLEITTIPGEPEANSQAVYAVYQKASSLLLGRVENRRMQAVCDLLNVVTENITHSRDIGHVLMQSYRVENVYRVHLGIADLGLGIPATLHPRYPDLGKGSDYLYKSLAMGVTSRTGSGGLGLYNADRIVRGQQGSLTIRAGNSMLQVFGDKVYFWDDLAHIPGTQVYITVWGNHDTSEWEYLLPKH
jgi:hypothetical protein